MTTKSQIYDHPQYITRQYHSFGINAAGASTVFTKWTAPTAAYVYSVTACNITAGTSTQTSWNGVGTSNVVQINADQFNVIHVWNGTAVATSTHGPFGISTGTATVTQTAGAVANIPLSGSYINTLGTLTGTTGNVQAGTNTTTLGAVYVNQGDTIHILRGTDTTAVSGFIMEWAPQPSANVTGPY